MTDDRDEAGVIGYGRSGDHAVRRGPRHAAAAAHRARDPRRAALLAFAVLAVALVAFVALSTPWETLPRPAGGRVPVDVRRDFTAAELAREDAYHRELWPAIFASSGAGVIVALLLGFTSAGARLVGAVARPLGGRRGWQLVLGTAAVTAVTTAATIPFGIWRESIQRDAGLVVHGWGDYAVDTATQYGLTAAGTLVGLAALYLLVKLFPRHWWAPGALVGAGLVVLSSYAYPVVVEPAFNDFHPMAAGPLRAELLELAAADGVDVQDVLVADASRRTSRVNAYVSGIGSSRRIVIYDTTLAQLTTPQIRTIIAHELGHVDEGDVLRGTAEGAVGMATAMCLLFALLGSPGVRRRAGLEPVGELDARGRRADTDPRSLALVLALVTGLLALVSPVELLVSRRVESRADAHSLDLTRDPATMASMQRMIALNNLGDLNPNPWVRALRGSHPYTPERIALARTWARLHGVPEPPDLVGPAGPAPGPGATPTPTSATPTPTSTSTPASTATPRAGPGTAPTARPTVSRPPTPQPRQGTPKPRAATPKPSAR